MRHIERLAAGMAERPYAAQQGLATGLADHFRQPPRGAAGGDDGDLADMFDAAFHGFVLGRNAKGAMRYKHALDPALQHGRQTEPPGRVDKDQRIAPEQVVQMLFHRSLVDAGLMVFPSFRGRHDRIEPDLVEIDHPDLVARGFQGTDDGIADRGIVTFGAGVAVDDERFHGRNS